MIATSSALSSLPALVRELQDLVGEKRLLALLLALLVGVVSENGK